MLRSEEKAGVLNPFNGIESIINSVTSPMKPVMNPFNGIESGDGKYSMACMLCLESIQWN